MEESRAKLAEYDRLCRQLHKALALAVNDPTTHLPLGVHIALADCHIAEAEAFIALDAHLNTLEEKLDTLEELDSHQSQANRFAAAMRAVDARMGGNHG